MCKAKLNWVCLTELMPAPIFTQWLNKQHYDTVLVETYCIGDDAGRHGYLHQTCRLELICCAKNIIRGPCPVNVVNRSESFLAGFLFSAQTCQNYILVTVDMRHVSEQRHRLTVSPWSSDLHICGPAGILTQRGLSYFYYHTHTQGLITTNTIYMEIWKSYLCTHNITYLPHFNMHSIQFCLRYFKSNYACWQFGLVCSVVTDWIMIIFITDAERQLDG